MVFESDSRDKKYALFGEWAPFRALEPSLESTPEAHMRKIITVDGQAVEISTALPTEQGGRWIGPIPDLLLEADEADGEYPFFHAGGHTPAWGGYRATTLGGVCYAHTSGTTLHPCLDEAGEVVWYVLAPNGRKAGRAMAIALGAHRAGRTDKEIRALGIFKSEVREGTDHWRVQVARAKELIQQGVAFQDALTRDIGPGHLRSAARALKVLEAYVPAEFRW